MFLHSDPLHCTTKEIPFLKWRRSVPRVKARSFLHYPIDIHYRFIHETPENQIISLMYCHNTANILTNAMYPSPTIRKASPLIWYVLLEGE